MTMTTSPYSTAVDGDRRVRLTPRHIELTFARIQRTHAQRYNDWRMRNENLEGDRAFRLPRIHEFYSRVLISEPERDALHVTRKVIEALMHHSLTGKSGIVAEWSKIHEMIAATVLDEIKADPQTPGERSLRDCIALLRKNSYDMPEGVYRFVRTPLVLRELERKYYVEDIEAY